MIDNITYNSMTEAGIKLNLDKQTISRRVKSNDVKFENYKYEDKKLENSFISKILRKLRSNLTIGSDMLDNETSFLKTYTGNKI